MCYLYVYIFTYVIGLNLAGNGPEYDYKYDPVSGGEVGECQFKGTKSTGGSACKQLDVTRTDFKQNDDLTWKILTKACPNLVYGGCGDPKWSTDEYNMDELVWYPGCAFCPRCSCSANQPHTYYLYNSSSVRSTKFRSSVCYECKCEDFYKNSQGNDVYARRCGEESTFDSVSALQNVHCPEDTPQPTPSPTGGCTDNGGGEYAPGDYFFIFDTDMDCDTYCTCNSTNGLECEEGWNNIIASETLKYEFYDLCGSRLQDAFNDTTRYNTANTATCVANTDLLDNANDRCPRADCGTYQAGADWKGIEYSKTIYDDDGNVDYVLYDCVDCSCIGNGQFVQCSTYDADSRSEEECTESNLICSADKNNDGAIADNNVDFEPCNEGEGQTYCGWMKMKAPDSFDPDVVCIENNIETDMKNVWGCQSNFMCDAFYDYNELQDSTTGLCSYNEVTFTAYTYDCLNYKWLSEGYKLEVNNMCCKGSECNNQNTISNTALGEANECTYNSAIQSYYSTKYECKYGDRGITNKDFLKAFKCSVALPQGKYDDDAGICKLIAAHWQYETKCACREAQVLEKTYPNDDYHDGLRSDLQLQFDEDKAGKKATLQAWADAYGCSSTFECDITDNAHDVKNNKLNLVFIVFISLFFIIV